MDCQVGRSHNIFPPASWLLLSSLDVVGEIAIISLRIYGYVMFCDIWRHLMLQRHHLGIQRLCLYAVLAALMAS